MIGVSIFIYAIIIAFLGYAFHLEDKYHFEEQNVIINLVTTVRYSWKNNCRMIMRWMFT